MNNNKGFCALVLAIYLMAACRPKQQQELAFAADHISGVITKMTEIMVHDITNPPLAARFFSYACLAGYEVVAQHNDTLPHMCGRLNAYPDLKRPDTIGGYAYQLSALLAIMETARKLQPSGSMLIAYRDRLLDSCRKAGVSEKVIEASQQYALAVSVQILAYAKTDGYSKISNYPRYTSLETEGSWYPTPPAYMAAVEPYFNTVRPFTLDTASQFRPAPPIPFSSAKNSAFFKLMLQNYQEQLDEEKKAIAGFWDCNPFAVQDKGHLMLALKKISPGAHWLGITGIACKQAKKSFDESMQIFTTVAVGLMDAFMSCWDEKYFSNRIRPETAIRKYIDANWQPLLQTPPFPEYTSGHSVISTASATILTHFFGEPFSYTDSVEVSYGLPPRSFTSFYHAADEAAISRFYGGIHFMDAIEEGQLQGRKAGEWVLWKMYGVKKENSDKVAAK